MSRPISDIVRDECPRFERDDADLIRQAVRTAGHGSVGRFPRWSHVGSIFGHGSGYSQAICRACGVDPDEMIGGDDDDGEE